MRVRSVAPVVLLGGILLAAGCADDGGALPQADAAPQAEDATPPAPDTAPTVGPITFEVQHYDYTFDLTTRQAQSVLTMTALTPGNCVPIRFRPGAARDVLLDGEPSDPVTIEGGVLTACSPTAGFASDQTLTLAATLDVPLQTRNPSQIGYSAKQDLEGHLFYYLVSWFEGCDRFGPCDSRPDRFATYRFTVTHPAGVRVFCPGLVTEGETVTECDFQYGGGPTYSTFGFAAGASWEDVDLGTFAGVHVRLHDEPQSGITARFPAAAVGAFLAWMQGTFGPYPYGPDLRYVVGETYWWGFEHPGNIVLSNTLGAPTIVYADDLTHVAMHEASHMWAGNQVTLASTDDFLWKEALAEYLTFVHEDDTLGTDASALTTAYWKEAAALAEYYPVPDDETDLFVYYGDAYGAGPLILFRQIEAMFGRPAVLGAVQSLLGAERTLSLDQLRGALETATGASLGGYFQAWLHGSGPPSWPRAAVTTTDVGGGAVEVAVALSTADGTPRGCAFDVRLTGAGGAHFDVRFDAGPDGDAPPPVTVTPGFAVTGTVLDPANECLVYKPGARLHARPAARRPWVVDEADRRRARGIDEGH